MGTLNSMSVPSSSMLARRPSQIYQLEAAPVSDLPKRVLDVVVASIALVALTPVFVVVACLIKLQDGGPIFFGQKRVGRNGDPFICYKFRSMVTDADALKARLAARNEHGEDAITFKIKRDPRVTPLGRLIRKASIDEIPQLFNVLRGEMSLVGPRPAVPSEVARYDARHLRRLEVLPGITCLWQVSGRAELPFEDQVRLDVQYIENRCLTLDLSILFRTIPAVISTRGAC